MGFSRQKYWSGVPLPSPIYNVYIYIYIYKTYKKDSNDSDNHNRVISHLEPDILECEVKWALGSITTNTLVEVMEFQLSYFKS